MFKRKQNTQTTRFAIPYEPWETWILFKYKNMRNLQKICFGWGSQTKNPIVLTTNGQIASHFITAQGKRIVVLHFIVVMPVLQ